MAHNEPRHLAAHRRPVFVGRPVVNPRIDPRVDHFLDPLAQPGPVALEAGSRRTDGDNRRAWLVTKEQLQHRGHRAAVGGVPRQVLRMLRCRKQRRPGGITLGPDVVVRIAVLDRRDRSPEIERVIRLPADDARIGRREVHQGQGTRRCRQVQAVRLDQLTRDAVPDGRWRGEPEARDLGLLVRPRRAGERPELFHLVVVARIAPAVKRRRSIRLEL